MCYFYWKSGQKLSYRADTFQEAVDRMLELRREHGTDFSGCSWFHYYDEKGERHWL
jgi:hypothetical protein